MTRWPRVAQLRTVSQLRERLARLGLELPLDERVDADGPLSKPLEAGGLRAGNRFAILPMEGWDAQADGSPGPLTLRRWRRFGESGAKLIWGGEAVAVRPDGRANPNQLLICEKTLPALARLRQSLVRSHAERFGRSDDLVVGLQLTHAGRYARPRPLVAYRHPFLDRRLDPHAAPEPVSDEQLSRLALDFVTASVLADRAGFQFVDLKHCHGYLGHELLSAFERPGRYGGSFENRTRFLREIVDGVRSSAPGLALGVRFSAFDFSPFRTGRDGVGEPEAAGPYPHAFGGDGTGLGTDLSEPCRLLDLLRSLDVRLVCVTAGSPYYNPHIQRPALFPPSDGYEPPEDPLAGVARQVAVTAALKRHRPELAVVGSAYSYLQEWLPHVAQAVVREGQADFVGIGRGALTYPDMPADVLEGRALDRRRVCRTFSDCTSAPRRGWVSGCYPLDPEYRERPEAGALAARRGAAEKVG